MVCCSGVVYTLSGGLLLSLQVGMRLNKVRLEQRPGLFLIQLGGPGLSVFLKFPCFRVKAVGNADNLSLYDGLARRSCVVNTLVKPRVEAFEWFVGIVGLLELPVILRQVRLQHSCVLCIEVAEEG